MTLQLIHDILRFTWIPKTLFSDFRIVTFIKNIQNFRNTPRIFLKIIHLFLVTYSVVETHSHQTRVQTYLPYTHFTSFSLIDWLFTSFTSPSRIFHSYGDVTIAGEGLQNLGLCLALRAFEQGGIFIVPHLLWRGTSWCFLTCKSKCRINW